MTFKERMELEEWAYLHGEFVNIPDRWADDEPADDEDEEEEDEEEE